MLKKSSLPTRRTTNIISFKFFTFQDIHIKHFKTAAFPAFGGTNNLYPALAGTLPTLRIFYKIFKCISTFVRFNLPFSSESFWFQGELFQMDNCPRYISFCWFYFAIIMLKKSSHPIRCTSNICLLIFLIYKHKTYQDRRISRLWWDKQPTLWNQELCQRSCKTSEFINVEIL